MNTLHKLVRKTVRKTVRNLGVVAFATTGCLATPVDPTLSGAFSCEDDTQCPTDQSCLQGVCVTGPLPQVTVLSPEEDSLVPHDDTLGEVRTLLVTLGGTNLDLVDAAQDPNAAVGAGQILIFVDGVEVATVDTGDITGTVSVEIEVSNRPGPHRVEARSQRSNGLAYDNEGASARRIFWFDDGNPHVVLKRPWPGAAIEIDAAMANVEVAAIGVTLQAPTTQVLPGIAHTHIHYDELFPACVMDNLCDQSYQGIVPVQDGILTGSVLLPSSSAGNATITAILRQANHTVFLDAQGEPVYDEVEVLRTGSVGGG